MTIRQIAILNKLRSNKKPISQADLANAFSVSIRTIQGDLKSINYYLNSAGISELTHQHNKGVQLKIAHRDEEKLEALIRNFSGQSEVFDVKMRREYIIKLFVISGGFHKLTDIADRIGVSRGTVINDLKAIREELKGQDIRLDADSRQGVTLEGEEGAVREYYLKKYLTNVKATCLTRIQDYHSSSIVNRFYEIRNLDDTSFVFDQVEQAIEDSKHKLTGNAFLKLISSLELAIERIKIGKTITFAPFYLESVYGTPEYKILHAMTDRIGDRLNITFALEEVGYLTFLLLGSNIVSVQHTDHEENRAEMQVAVFKLIQAVESELGADFSQDETLYNDLVYHICPAVFRIKNGIIQINPLKDGIQNQYPHIFRAVMRHVHTLEDFIGEKFSDDEICYIVIHFAAVKERQHKNSLECPRVLIVCDSGISTSNLLAARLMSIYDVNVLDTIAYYELEKKLEDLDVDYILSTLELNHEEKTVIRVNPLISEMDMKRLNRYFKKRRYFDFDEARFMEILEKYSQIADKDALKKDLSKAFSFNFKTIQKDVESEEMLIDVLQKNMMALDFPAKDWEEAVRESGRLLMAGGCCDQTYIEEMVSTVKKMGAYIVISKGIALPHSRSGEHSSKVGISLLRLKTPVSFGHPENDPVDLVFGLASIDNKAHLSALRDFSKIFSDPNNAEIIREAKTAEEIYDFLIKLEKKDQ